MVCCYRHMETTFTWTTIMKNTTCLLICSHFIEYAIKLLFFRHCAIFTHSSFNRRGRRHGRPHIGANGVSWPPWKNGWKINSENMQKKRAVFCVYVNILTAIRAGRCREGRYADHTFIQIYFRMHHFVVKFSKFSSSQAARGHWPPNQNPADVPGRRPCLRVVCLSVGRRHSLTGVTCRRLAVLLTTISCLSLIDPRDKIVL